MDRAKILYATLAALAIVAAFAGYRLLGGSGQPDGAGQETADMPVAAGALSAQQLRRLGVQTVAAEAAMDVPLGTVPGAITLPPEAQVAVTAPFDGAIVRLHVIQGQQVSAGQALATVRSREPLQYGAELARGWAWPKPAPHVPVSWSMKALSQARAPTR